VNRRHRTLWPVVRERAAQVALLQSLLRDLGLERKPKEMDVAALLAALQAPRLRRANMMRKRRQGPGGLTP